MLNVSIRSNGRRHHAAGGSGSVANHSWLLLVVVVLRRSGRGGNMLHNGRVQPLLLLLSSVVNLLLLLHRPGRVRCRSGHAGANRRRRRSGAGGGHRVRHESHLRWHSSSCCWRLLRGLIHGLRLRRPGRIRTAAASNTCSRSAHIRADRRHGVCGGHGACHLGLVLLRWRRWRRLLQPKRSYWRRWRQARCLSLGVGVAALVAVAGRVRCRSGHAGANRRSGAGGGRRVRRESHLRWHSSSCCWRLLRGWIHGLRLRLRLHRPGRIRTAAASNACSFDDSLVKFILGTANGAVCQRRKRW